MAEWKRKRGENGDIEDRDMVSARVSRRSVVAGLCAGGMAAAFGSSGGPALAQAPRAREGRYLLKNGVVLSLDPAIGDFDRADVLVEGRKISAVRPNITASATVIDASNTIVHPGFRGHPSPLLSELPCATFSAMAFCRITSVTSSTRRRRSIASRTPISASCRAHCDRSSAGITSVVDLSQASNTPEHSPTRWSRRSKRAAFARCTPISAATAPERKYPHDVERIQKQHFSAADQLVTLAMASGINKEQWQLARNARVAQLSRTWSAAYRLSRRRPS